MCDCAYDYEPPEFLNIVARKAAKDYKCSECRRIISKGEPYECHTGKWEGRISTFRWCEHCAKSAQIIANETKCFCILYGGLWEDLPDHEENSRPNKTATKIRAGVNRRWTHKRGPKKGQLMPVPTIRAKETH